MKWLTKLSSHPRLLKPQFRSEIWVSEKLFSTHFLAVDSFPPPFLSIWRENCKEGDVKNEDWTWHGPWGTTSTLSSWQIHFCRPHCIIFQEIHHSTPFWLINFYWKLHFTKLLLWIFWSFDLLILWILDISNLWSFESLILCISDPLLP